jgi:hypothetical protein
MCQYFLHTSEIYLVVHPLILTSILDLDPLDAISRFEELATQPFLLVNSRNRSYQVYLRIEARLRG